MGVMTRNRPPSAPEPFAIDPAILQAQADYDQAQRRYTELRGQWKDAKGRLAWQEGHDTPASDPVAEHERQQTLAATRAEVERIEAELAIVAEVIAAASATGMQNANASERRRAREHYASHYGPLVVRLQEQLTPAVATLREIQSLLAEATAAQETLTGMPGSVGGPFGLPFPPDALRRLAYPDTASTPNPWGVFLDALREAGIPASEPKWTQI